MKFRRITTREEVYSGIDLWNSLNPSFFIIPRLVEQNIFAPFAGVNIIGWGGFEDSRLIAFGLAKYLTTPIPDNADLNQGWISLLVIDKERVDIDSTGKELLKKLEDDLQARGVEKIRFGGDPQNFLPGLPAELIDDLLPLLMNSGFESKNKEYDLYRDISDFKINPRINKLKEEAGDKLKACPVSKEEEKFLLDFLQENFPGRWYYEADNILRIPGGVEDYWLLWYQEETVGFARTNTSESTYQGPNVNWGSRWGKTYCGLGPIGIASNYRGKGWGLYLMSEIIKSFQQRGYRHMMIDWTTLLDYYARLGFKPWIKYLTLYKDL